MSALSIFDAARQAPRDVALIANGRDWTYSELAARVEAIDAGDRVVMVDGRDVETAIAFYAALEKRVPFVPIHGALTVAEREKLHVPAIPQYAGEEAIAAVIHTSGTEGRPKAALLSRRALAAHASASGAVIPFAPGDRWLACLPLAHVGGLMILVRALAARATAFLAPRFDPAIDATHISLVPSQLARHLDELRARIVLVGGAACPPALVARARDRKIPLRLTWGCTEACSQVATWRDENDDGCGAPLPGFEVRSDDERLLVRGPSLFSGYAGSPHEGWLDTGDLGFVDERGRVHVRGRRGDRIVTGGEKVDPVEVEHALLASAGIREAGVFGVEDARWGHVVAAAIVAGDAFDEPALARDLRARLAPFKRPRLLARVDSLPVTAAGKLDRRALSLLAADRVHAF